MAPDDRDSGSNGVPDEPSEPPYILATSCPSPKDAAEYKGIGKPEVGDIVVVRIVKEKCDTSNKLLDGLNKLKFPLTMRHLIVRIHRRSLDKFLASTTGNEFLKSLDKQSQAHFKTIKYAAQFYSSLKAECSSSTKEKTLMSFNSILDSTGLTVEAQVSMHNLMESLNMKAHSPFFTLDQLETNLKPVYHGTEHYNDVLSTLTCFRAAERVFNVDIKDL